MQATLQAVLSGGACTTPSEPTRRLLQLLEELLAGTTPTSHGARPTAARAPPAAYAPPPSSHGGANGSLSSGSGSALPPPGLGHAQVTTQVTTPPGLGGCLGGGGGGVERANVTYSTPETRELPPAAVVGLGPREAERGGTPLGGLGLEGEGEEEEAIDNYDDLAKLPSFFSNMNGDDDDALE